MIINNIRVLLDSLHSVYDSYVVRYKSIIDNAKEYLKKTADIIKKVQDIIDNVSNNINKLEYKEDELKRKLYSLESEMNSHYNSYESYKREADAIYDAGHWETINNYDDEGNLTSSESFWYYDFDAHSRATDNANRELDEYNRIKVVYDRVHEVYMMIVDRLEYLYALRNFVSKALDKIDESYYNIKKYSNSMDKEIEYNEKTLLSAIIILDRYNGLKKFYYENVTTLHSMFPGALLGVMQTYNNIFYDDNHTDKINVSLNKLHNASNAILALESEVKVSIKDIVDALSTSNGMVDGNLGKLFNNYISIVKEFENEVDRVRQDTVLCLELRRNELTNYQSHRYMKSKIN